MRFWRRWLLLVLLWPLVSLAGGEILLTGAQDSSGVREFVEALKTRRPADTVRFVPLAQLPEPARLRSDTRLILLDPEALDWRMREPAGPPALVLRISRVQARQRLGDLRPAYLSLLWSDPPLARQLHLVRYLLPQAHRVGVLYSEQSRFLLDELRQAALPLGMEIDAQPWPDLRDNRPLQSLLKETDVLLGLDDPSLYNPKTAKNLLLSAYSRQMALVGPNAGFVRAGALASTFSDQNAWLAVIDRLLDQPPEKWPRSHYPEYFSVTGNQQVARALGIEAIDPDAARQAVSAGESAR
ncbi:ABC transporter substrate-binding protein [Pseudomonas putida CSV86]|uniref:ABC transporter substrate-binding protein n=1 Tax=Pseudomonas bharatica CSV86 TaxID=1005395 RepID=L1M535_9PSED|nr:MULTISPECIES: ABC transporter substrate-binding protein [Pseudomonas]MDG9885520.1 ABC transporter substrate-binding protein [Pseudomonas sp. GD04058]NNJ16467.1 ABC transporter substrate-binding protein [Pseudomonas bharatica CSV86]